MAPEPLSPDEAYRRKIVGVNPETVTNVSSTDFPGHYPGENHAWDLECFRKNFRVEFHQNAPYNASFSLINIDASIANAFRRILLAEIPSLAIENVFIYNNTSIIQDEVLAHRLGLIPLTGNAEGLNWLRWYHKPEDDKPENDNRSDFNTVVLKLNAKCEWTKEAKELMKKGITDPARLYKGTNVYAKDITFHPVGRQMDFFTQEKGEIRTSNPDILVAKMRPGQEIRLEMHCVKGVGADHAKFSPVATASYRLLPTIEIMKPIVGQDARKFARCFPKGVVGLEEVSEEEATREGSAYVGNLGEKKAVVRNPFKDTVSRECLRHQEFEGKVKLGRIRDHFIFMVESTGQFKSDELFMESVRALKVKCDKMLRNLPNVHH